MKTSIPLVLMVPFAFYLCVGCPSVPGGGGDSTNGPFEDDGPVADGVSAKLGETIPSATAEQQETA